MAALLGALFPQGLRQKLRLLQRFQAWQRGRAALRALALPQLHIKVCVLAMVSLFPSLTLLFCSLLVCSPHVNWETGAG